VLPFALSAIAGELDLGNACVVLKFLIESKY
jgi:hypothetical protein